jgi:hypothetical protein
MCRAESIELFIERLSRHPMIWLLPYTPSPPSPVSKLDRRHTVRLRKERQLAYGAGGRRWWGRRESLYKSFNTLWCRLCVMVVNVYVTCMNCRTGAQTFHIGLLRIGYETYRY